MVSEPLRDPFYSEHIKSSSTAPDHHLREIVLSHEPQNFGQRVAGGKATHLSREYWY